RAGDGRCPPRELSCRLPRLLAASPPLGPGRLAAAPLARPPGAPRGWRNRTEPVVADLAVEDHRQPSTHLTSPDAARLPAVRVDRVSRRVCRVDRDRRACAGCPPAHRSGGRPAL